MKRILFVCSGNTCRSPMAQFLFQKIMEDRQKKEFEALSAGLFTCEGLPASAEAIEAMSGEGIDLSPHRSVRVNQEIIASSDLILAMTAEHYRFLMDSFPEKRDCIFTVSGYAGIGEQDIYDPYGWGKQEYLHTLNQLKRIIEKVVDNLSSR